MSRPISGIKNLAQRALTGDVQAVAEQRKHSESRRKLLGLDARAAPTRFEVSGKDGGAIDLDLSSLTNEELAERGRQLVRQIEALSDEK